jgi:RNA polymerase-binding transcription factor DksA
MKRALSKDDIAAYEHRLRVMLDGYSERTANVEDHTLHPSGDPQGQKEDEGIDDAALERESEVLATIDALSYQVRDALARVEDGSYGTCERCGEAIAMARLEQLPYAVTCAKCAHELEGSTYDRDNGRTGR